MNEELDWLAGMLGILSVKGGAMSVVEMDGFVAGLALQPERVPLSEWMAHVLGEGTEFEDNDAARVFESAVIRHCNGVIRTLADEAELYGPVLEVDEGTHEVIWKPWIGGFSRAMRLRPGAWARIEASKELDVLEAMQVVQTLYAAANGTSRLSEEGLDLLDTMAPVLIGGMVQDLNEIKESQGASAAERLGREAVGGTRVRDALCGCGSARPSHGCCGAH
ncbi:UPF0149 family protein [Candidatus Rariloculus sp.]|uniref:UPF0149 family protein n=1 Tax=Candidatus Rariloculus sp. TaxID=3101265 RepID=UPI003D0D4CB9